MGDLKPVGSEKLQGDDKIKRILELTYYKQNTVNENNTAKKAELIKESSNGVYGIVREKDGYYVKKGLNEGTLDYIGGLFMKNKNRFNSYAEALKRLELLKSHEINEEATRYVLKKTDKATDEAPLPQDSVDDMPMALPPADSAEPSAEPMAASGEMPTDAAPQDSAPQPEMGDSESGKRSDYMAEVQKFAGKLGQELRDQQPKMESDDIKYVLNMIISAVDLDKLEEDDIEEIGKKFERDEESVSGEPESEPELEPAPEEDDSDEKIGATPEDDLSERISKLEELINTKFYSNEQDLGEDESEDYFPDIDSAYEDKTHLDYDPTDDYRIDNRPSRMYDDEDEEINLNLDITPELDDINESINTTLSKYFE